MQLFAYGSSMIVGITAGGFLFMYAVVARATRRLDAANYTRIHQAMIPIATRYMTALVVAAFLATAPLVLLLLPHGAGGAIVAATVAVAAIVVVILTSVLVNVPMNRRMALWTASDPPADWAGIRDRWIRFHLVRTAAATVAFGCLLLAVLMEAA